MDEPVDRWSGLWSDLVRNEIRLHHERIEAEYEQAQVRRQVPTLFDLEPEKAQSQP